MSILSTKILLAVNGSKEAYLSARAAVDIARLSGSELHLVHVEEHPPHLLADYGPFVYTDTEAIQTVVERAERQAREVLNKQVARVKDIVGTISQSYFRQGIQTKRLLD